MHTQAQAQTPAQRYLAHCDIRDRRRLRDTKRTAIMHIRGFLRWCTLLGGFAAIGAGLYCAGRWVILH